MKECIYSIPLTDAFKADCECPFCELQNLFEKNIIEYYLGDSVMTDDVRAKTDKTGFCKNHFKMLFDAQMRLPLALMLQTHLGKIIDDMEKNPSQYQAEKKGFGFLKANKNNADKATDLHTVNSSCVVCTDLDEQMDLLFSNFFFLYKKEAEFKKLFEDSKGFCVPHFLELLEHSRKELSGSTLDTFNKTFVPLMMNNLKRVKDDIDWYIQKFDYRFTNEPWKNSKDAVDRSIQKVSSLKLS